MRTRQLRLLIVFRLQDRPETYKELLVALLFVLTEGSYESVAHGTSGSPSFLSISTRLRIFTTAPRYDISRARPCRFRVIIGLLGASCGRMENTLPRGHHTGNVATRIRRHSGKETLASLSGQIWLFHLALRGVDIRKIKDGARVTRVKYGCQTTTRW